MKLSLIGLLLVTAGLNVACEQQQVVSQEFALPAGDAEQGQLTFINYGCIECHTLAGTTIVEDEMSHDDAVNNDTVNNNIVKNDQRDIKVEIGGAETKMQTYADLVTAVINPSHKIAKGYDKESVVNAEGESKMRVYNDVMTVAELIDLVTFLKSEYELISPPLVMFPDYIYPE